jgi:glutamyl-Q tRNA(Asp) synthetase
MAAPGWCASKTSTRRAASPAPTSTSCSSWPNAACIPTPPVWQSQRQAHYAAALEQLRHSGDLAYPCGCGRRDLEAAWAAQGVVHVRHVERPYPGTCRHGLHGKPARSWRFRLDEYVRDWPARQAAGATPAGFVLEDGCLQWQDRRLGPQTQRPVEAVGDFILQRADGLYAYQLAVVVDDALQGITHVVRGEDLTDNTPARCCCSMPWACRHRPICTRRWC